jgi:hypothetical protein
MDRHKRIQITREKMKYKGEDKEQSEDAEPEGR